MKLAYCFTSRIMDDTSAGTLDQYKILIEKSIYSGMRFHSVTLYTDKETLPHLNHIQCKKVLIDTDGFYYLDDFKMGVLSLVDSDTVLVDTDVIFWHKLTIPEEYDVYADRPEDFTKNAYEWHYDHFIKNNVLDIYPHFLPIPKYIPNIGLLYFKNEALKNEYIKLYWEIRNWLIGGKFWYKGASVILGQYLLGTIIQWGEYSIYYLFNTPNNLYDHYCGNRKFIDFRFDNLDVQYTPKKWI